MSRTLATAAPVLFALGCATPAAEYAPAEPVEDIAIEGDERDW